MEWRVGLWRRLSAEELMLLNCGVGEDSWDSLGLQGDPPSPFWRRSTLDFFGRSDAKAETPILWPPHVKSWLMGKDPDADRDWGQEEKGMTEDEMAGWHHRLHGHEFEWTRGVGDGQGSLACCSPQGTKSQMWLSNWAPGQCNLKEEQLPIWPFDILTYLYSFSLHHWAMDMRMKILPSRNVISVSHWYISYNKLWYYTHLNFKEF